MVDRIGLGLLLNILFWTLVVLAATGLASMAAIEYFPGRERRQDGTPRTPARDREDHDRGADDEIVEGEGEEQERYRKAS